ncbi:MAG TPA: prephenate dehydrogenase/arogenate dehydrogenase family protein [Casimicrobiaceae bacterium]|nr:prephenate dehydrogenase/arogenate dehydrogenase family protein [Casimicrobiaceae bacterium]
MSSPATGKLVVVGTGLIGGSFALALKNAGQVGGVVGVGRGRENLEQALRLGVVDRAYTRGEDWTAELADAALVLLATPVGEMPELFAAIAPHLGPETIVSDAGSTKQDVIAAARAVLGAAFSRFVPAHPIAGSERSGAGAASVSLFRGRQVVLTPLPETDPAAVERVRAWWTRCGATVTLLGPERHDALLSAVSHLPHLLAFALIGELADRPDAADYWGVAGNGLRDFTRLADSHPDMWRDICIANAARLRADLAAYRQQLDRIDAMLARADGGALGALFERSGTARAALLSGGRGGDDAG